MRAESPVVADFVARLDELLSRMLSNVLRDHVRAGELQIAVDTFRATVKGVVKVSASARDERCSHSRSSG